MSEIIVPAARAISDKWDVYLALWRGFSLNRTLISGYVIYSALIQASWKFLNCMFYE